MSSSGAPPAKRFVLFVQQKMSERDLLALRALQEGEAPLQKHVSLFPITEENRLTLPAVVRGTTPLLFDVVAGTASTNAVAVLKAMTKRLNALPLPAATGSTHRAATTPAEPQQSASRVAAVPLDLGEGYGKAQLSEAVPLLEARSAIGGQGFAGSGSGFMGSCAGRVGCRLEEDNWGTATVAFDEDAANRHMHEAFGLSAADIQRASATHSAKAPSDGRYAAQEGRGKLKGEDDAELKDLIARREQLDRAFKERTQGNGTAATVAASTVAFMEPPKSREERLAGVEGMMSLRPITAAGGAGKAASDSFPGSGF